MQNNMTKEFVFLNARPALTPSVKQVLEYVEGHFSKHEHLHDIYFKTKAVVTELLTNGFKHAGTPTISLLVDIGAKYLTIKKQENGTPFSFITYRALPGTKKRLAYDIMHQLFAVNEPDNTIRFVVEESDIDAPDINQVTEHFGLLIIAKCTEDFTYNYNEHTKTNSFTAKVKIPVALASGE